MKAPEYILRAGSFNSRLTGLKIEKLVIYKDDCLNIPPRNFKEKAEGAHIMCVKVYDKWIFLTLSTGQSIMINPGIGGDVRLGCGSASKNLNTITILFSENVSLESEMRLFGKFYLASEKELLKSKFSFNLRKIIPETSPSYILKRIAEKNTK